MNCILPSLLDTGIIMANFDAEVLSTTLIGRLWNSGVDVLLARNGLYGDPFMCAEGWPGRAKSNIKPRMACILR